MAPHTLVTRYEESEWSSVESQHLPKSMLTMCPEGRRPKSVRSNSQKAPAGRIHSFGTVTLSLKVCVQESRADVTTANVVIPLVRQREDLAQRHAARCRAEEANVFLQALLETAHAATRLSFIAVWALVDPSRRQRLLADEVLFVDDPTRVEIDQGAEVLLPRS